MMQRRGFLARLCLRPPRAMKAWSAALAATIAKESYFTKMMGRAKDSPIIISPSWYEALKGGDK
jgi:hypothetical protein